VRWLAFAAFEFVLSVGIGLQASAQSIRGEDSRKDTPGRQEASAPFIDEIVFEGLRRIAPAAAQAQISLRPGASVNARQLQSDVKKLGSLGWFDEIQIEERPAARIVPAGTEPQNRVTVVFRVHELPQLVDVEYTGSRLLSSAQIRKLLEEQHLSPRFGEPADDVSLHRAAIAIQMALAELGHPQALAAIHRDESPDWTLRIRYVIHDGTHLPVGRIVFESDPRVPARTLRRAMPRTSPSALFAYWRGKGVFTRAGFAEDRSKLLIYYQDHGSPEARIGDPRSSVYETTSRRWLPRPFRQTGQRLSVTVPIEAGPYYRITSVTVDPDLAAASGKHAHKMLAISNAQAGSAYSAKTAEDLRHLWLIAAQPRRAQNAAGPQRTVEAERSFDIDNHEARLRIAFSDAPPDIVRHIEFLGNHRFSDRYLRRRIGLVEGQPFDERGLELGLARLAKTGYFHQIRKEDLHVTRDEFAHAADVTIRVSEAGQQRTSFSGGRGQFGSTLGLAYSLFDTLQREELLSAQFDAGPESLQIALSLVMEGFLGSRSSLAISLFDIFLRPRFASSVKGPFYTSRSDGLNTNWGYALTSTDSVSVQYALSHSKTDFPVTLPPSLTGIPAPDLTTQTTSSAVGVALNHDAGSNRFSVANSVSGGLLAGTENLLRSNEDYARIFPDPLFHRQNSWAFRTTFSAAGSYQGDMPIGARLFSGDAQMRGFRPGELGPYAVIPTTSANGNQTYTAIPAGANLVSAANLEYRIPLEGSMQAAGFFDWGSGWLLPNWLGKSRPTLLDSTNGVLHGSLGIELRWTVPEIQVPVRAYYSVNVLRLNRFLPLPDGTLFHAHNKLFSFGWALGNLF
jgi:outer membrane protein assembly complex protein YaeT